MNKSRILDHLREDNAHYDPDIVFAEAKREKVCPFEVQLELAARADAVVADYNYVFEPGTGFAPSQSREIRTKPFCWSTKRTICPIAVERSSRPNSSKNNFATSSNGCPPCARTKKK